MGKPSVEYNRVPTWPGPMDGRGSWWCALAAEKLERRLLRRGVLTFRQTAVTVTGVLPRVWGRWLYGQLAARGWLRSDTVVPFYVLNEQNCAPVLRPCRRLVQLAVFGLGGQGLAWRDRHRHDVYQRLCAEIMREAVDLVSLQNISDRLMHHPDVAQDGILAGWLRAFVAERHAALHTLRTPDELYRKESEASKVVHGFRADGRRGFPTRAETMDRFQRLHRDLDRQMAQFEERGAARTLDKMRELRRQFPAHVPADELQRCEEQYDRLLKRAGAYRRQVRELAGKACEAARVGDHKTAAWVSRRLDAIHALFPILLPQSDLEALRAEIHRCGHEHESEEAARELWERRREVALRIKNLAGIVQRFHQVAQKLPPEHNAYRRAELNYRRAIDEIREMDTEWLSGLVIELESLADDLDDPTDRVQNQLDQFIADVRTALNRLCEMIRRHQRERGRQRPAGGPAGDPPTG